MKRLLVSQIPEVGQRMDAPEEERRHLQDVRRISEGETLEVLDGCGGLALAKIVALAKNRLVLEIERHLLEPRESPLHLSVALAIPSQLSTFDDMLPGLVQLGVQNLYLFPSTWGGRLKKDGAKYTQRLATIAQQALKQCGRTWAPCIEFPKDLNETLDGLGSLDLAVMFHPVPEQPPLPSSAKRLGLLIGPEGGFTAEEVAQAQERGLLVKGLGPRILKMETAAIGACFWAQSRYGDLV